jgi:RNA polymerase sigma-70 factor (ECF subfamily)
MNTVELGKLRDAGAKWLRSKHLLNATDAEDVLQDALIELVRVDDSLHLRDPGAFLGTILDRRVKDKMRANKTRTDRETPAGDATDLGALGGQGLSMRDGLFAAAFDGALRSLPTEERDAFILTDLRGLTQYEAALALNVPAHTVRNRVDRAKALMRKELA